MGGGGSTVRGVASSAWSGAAYHICEAGIVDTVLCGVVGREPARDALRDAMVPI